MDAVTVDVRAVGRALEDAGDREGALLWTRSVRELDAGLAVAVVAKDASLATRVARRLEQAHGDVRFVAFGFAPSEDDEPALEDRLLGCHAVVWATALPAALGAEERRALGLLGAAGAPSRRVVVLADAWMLERMAEDPGREAAEIRERLLHLLPSAWSLVDEPKLADVVASLSSGDVAAVRKGEVARLLVDDALGRAGRALEAEEATLATIADLLGQHDEALATARRDGERVAAHVLGATRRQAGKMLVDVRDALQRLEADLPAQIATIDDLDEVRRVLPHWIEHVVATQLQDRLAAFRAGVVAELREVGLGDDDARRADLLLPALPLSPMGASPDWGHRLSVSAALAGGAALLLSGLWIPAALALGAGLYWSATGRDAREGASRDKLVESAQAAVRAIGAEVDRVLGDQLQQIEADLAAFGPEREKAAAEGGKADRERLEGRRTFHRARADALRATRDRLVTARTELDG